MSSTDLALMAHLLRRAGFGATRGDLESYTSRSYEQVVDDLLHPERFPEIDEDVLNRYYSGLNSWEPISVYSGAWIYRMINTRRPLQEKMALFWHHIFATGFHKSEHTPSLVRQIDTFRSNGFSNMRDILLDLSRDPAMIDWLDNEENHKHEINENFGRELLELFSMGVGNYTEDDIKAASRAFTGWTFRQPIPIYPFGHHIAEFVYLEDDHDDSEKTFLGHTGRFNGEDIIDIVVRQPATANFICRHLYNFFVADEPQVPAWQVVPPQDPAAIETLTRAYIESDGEIGSVLKALFRSEFFKQARGKKVKSPTEIVVGAAKLAGVQRFPDPGLTELGEAAAVMGQFLYNAPTVEGWHTGKEWVDGGTLNERVNFAVNLVADATQPGIQEIIEGVRGSGAPLSPGEFVDRCLDQAGALEVSESTRSAMVHSAESAGELRFDGETGQASSHVVQMLQLIVSSTEYQFA
jgi:uncharacterized protein (DUF1800 family)